MHNSGVDELVDEIDTKSCDKKSDLNTNVYHLNESVIKVLRDILVDASR